MGLEPVEYQYIVHRAVNEISASDQALGQLSVSAAIESVLGGRFNGNDSGTIESAGIESGICECYRRIIRERNS